MERILHDLCEESIGSANLVIGPAETQASFMISVRRNECMNMRFSKLSFIKRTLYQSPYFIHSFF